MPYAIFNVIAISALAVAIRHGFLTALWGNDPTYIGSGIIVLFAICLLIGSLMPHKFLYRCATLMVTAGFFGTLVGFAYALSDVDAGALASVEDVSLMIATMMEGVGAIVWTSICGFAFGTWTLINYWLLGGDL